MSFAGSMMGCYGLPQLIIVHRPGEGYINDLALGVRRHRTLQAHSIPQSSLCLVYHHQCPTSHAPTHTHVPPTLPAISQDGSNNTMPTMTLGFTSTSPRASLNGRIPQTMQSHKRRRMHLLVDHRRPPTKRQVINPMVERLRNRHCLHPLPHLRRNNNNPRNEVSVGS